MTSAGDSFRIAKAPEANESTPLVGEQQLPNAEVIMNVIFAGLCGMLLGYDIGVVTGIIHPIAKVFSLGTVQTELFVGSLNAAALLGCAVSSFFADKYGRRMTMAAAGALFFVGNLLTAVGWSYISLITGRAIAGVGMGLTLVLGPIYTAELSPAQWRGMLITCTEVSINIGLVAGAFASWFVDSWGVSDSNWRFVVGFGCLPSLIMCLAAVFYMVESPRWLAMQGRMSDAEAALLKLVDEKEARKALDELSPTALLMQSQKASLADLFGESKLRWTLLVGCMVAFMSHATGCESLQYYAVVIFEKAGFSRSLALNLFFWVSVVKLLMAVLCASLVDSFGRRPLLITSSLGVALSMAAMAMGSWSGQPILQAVCVFTFFSFFSLGYGPLVYVVNAEIYPQAYRSLGSSIGMGVARMTSALVALTYLSVAEVLTQGGSFALFSVMAFFGTSFMIFYLPETKGTTLESVNKLLS